MRAPFLPVTTPTVQTSKVAYEIDDFHLPVRFNVTVVQVRVEHDDGKRQEEDRFGTAEVFHVLRIALAVTTGKRLEKYIARRSRDSRQSKLLLIPYAIQNTHSLQLISVT